MDFRTLYSMMEKPQRSGFQAVPRDSSIDLPAIYTGEVTVEGTITFNHESGGSAPKDFVGTGHGVTPLVSERVISVLRDRGFTGWSTYPITLLGKHREEIAGYHGLVITGRCGAVDDTKSEVVLREPRVPGGPRHREKVGIFFDPATWDGSDLFIPEGTLITVVREPVKLALEKAKATNVIFTSLAEFAVMV